MNDLDGGKVEGRVRKHSYRKYFSEFYIFATLVRTRHIHEEIVLAVNSSNPCFKNCSEESCRSLIDIESCYSRKVSGHEILIYLHRVIQS